MVFYLHLMINIIENIQRRASLFVYNDHRSRDPGCVTNMLQSLEWEPLAQRRKVARLVTFHKIINKTVAITPSQHLSQGDRRTQGAHKYILYLPNLHQQKCLQIDYSFFPEPAEIGIPYQLQ